MTQADLKIAISRLSIRINKELGGQEACDRLEQEMIKLQSQLEEPVIHKD